MNNKLLSLRMLLVLMLASIVKTRLNVTQFPHKFLHGRPSTISPNPCQVRFQLDGKI